MIYWSVRIIRIYFCFKNIGYYVFSGYLLVDIGDFFSFFVIGRGVIYYYIIILKEGDEFRV